MGYGKSRATIKWWYPHTKKLKYCSSAKIDERKTNLENDDHPVLN